MEVSQCSFSELSFSSLLQDYVHDFAKLSEFYQYNPFNDQDLKERSNELRVSDQKEQIVKAIGEFHKSYGIHKAQESILKEFAKPETQVVVTGQQLCLFGGPLFTIYKTLTAIATAKEWSDKLGKKVIPVFWMADEDHDYEEVNIVGLPGYSEYQTLNLAEDSSNKAVSEINIHGVEDLFQELQQLLQPTDFTTDVVNWLHECYEDGNTHGVSFARLMSSIFSKHGVLIVGSNHPAIKKIVSTQFIDSVRNRDAIQNLLQDASESIAKDYHQQVVVGTSNLFYMDEKKGRTKINFENDKWVLEGKGEFSDEELISHIQKNPEKFSPNVFLRPIIQDHLLPTLAYVAGPGELSYYGQMKNYYVAFGLKMPLILPRFSSTLVEGGISKAMESLPFTIGKYGSRIEDLTSEYMNMQEGFDPNFVINEWIRTSNQNASGFVNDIEKFDQSLKKSAESVLSSFTNELNKLRGKLNKSAKQREETQLNRIRKVQSQLYPGGGLQERQVSFIYFMNKYGLDVWDKILDEMLQNNLSLKSHHVIHL